MATKLQELTRRELSLRRREIVDRVKWKWFNDIGWNPHRFQILSHLSKSRFRYTTSGRRGGKTAWASKEASAYSIAGPYRTWFAGPSYDLTQMEWVNYIQTLQNPANPHEIVRLNSNKQSGNLYLQLSNGAEAEGISLAQAERNPAIGQEIDLLVLCEGARISNLGGDDGLWETQLDGNLSSRLGDLICPTTPKGKDNWLHPRFEVAEKGNDPDSFALRWPAWENVEGFLEDPVRKKQTMSPRAFQQEVLGLFVSWFGAIWIEDCGFNPELHVIPSFKYIPPWWNRIEILDPGWADWAVWIAAVIDNYGVVYIVDELKMKMTRYSDLAFEILRRRENMYGRSNVPKHIPLYIDPEEPRARADLPAEAKKLGGRIACLPADNHVWSGFEAGASRFKNDLFFITANCRYIIDSLSNHEWSGNVKSNGDKIQKRSEYIHGSDVARYLQLTPIRASKEKVELHQTQLMGKDLLGMTDSTSPLGMTMDDFKRLHEMAA
jgi:hypothetical protein